MTPVFDYIVVGSGSGGAPVARRLVDAGAEVALIEAGLPAFDAPEVTDPTRWVSLATGRRDWGHSYAPDPALHGRTIPLPRGRALGGSSATNAMMWYRGHPADYDLWAQTCPGWSFAECLPFFRAAEDWEGGATALRGAGGPLRITRSPDLHPVAAALMEAAAELGLPRTDDPNGPQPEGAAPANLNIAAGRRHGSAEGYLRPILGRPNLTLLTGSRVTRLLIARGRVAGVVRRQSPHETEARHLGADTSDPMSRPDRAAPPSRLAADLHRAREVEVHARNGVILCAGAIETPRLLILSGIGPEADLARLGVPLHVHAPHVGLNLQDHPLVRAVNARARQPLPPPRDNGGGTILNWRSSAADRPDLHAFPVAGRSATPAVAERYPLDGDLFAIGAGLMRSRSRGWLRVLSADPDAPLEIRARFLSDPHDLAALCEAAAFAQALLETRAFAPLFAGHAAPDRRLEGPALEDFVRLACSTFFHPCGTARMGDDPDAVCSPRLTVNGLDGLRIADASVIPVIPACNTHAPVTMIGERAAAFILEDV